VSEWRRVNGCGKRDRNEADIVSALEAQGATVTKLAGPGVPDLLVGHAGRLLLMEVKVNNAGLTEEQKTWHDEWQGPRVPIVRTPAQAVKALRMAAPTLTDVVRAAQDTKETAA
jgi:hypothetical protein